MIANVPREFKTINSSKIEFEDNRILSRSEEGFFYYIIGFLVLLLDFVFICWITRNSDGSYVRIPKDSPLSMLGGFLIVIQFIIIDACVRLYNVVDFADNCVYKEFLFFGLRTRYSVYSRNDLIQIGNSVVGLYTNPGGKNGRVNGRFVKLDPDTNLFHSYQVHFLTKDGSVFNMGFGYFLEEFKDTIKFVKLLSDYWYIPKILCEDNYQLRVVRTRGDSYIFVDEKIPYHSWFEKLFMLFLFFAAIAVIGYMLVSFTEKYSGKKSKSYKPTYRYERRYPYRR